jgi:class 3 adenylate cyclase
MLAVDMRGFSMTVALNDAVSTDLVGDYLTELTAVVERHHEWSSNIRHGLLGLFLPSSLARLVRSSSSAW